MTGVIAGRGFRTDKLQRFGYIRLTAQTDTVLCPAGASIPVTNFTIGTRTQTAAPAPRGGRNGQSWPCVHRTKTLFAGFPHLYFYGNPLFCR
jgi:cobyrinic acid a,c-diamide synthase